MAFFFRLGLSALWGKYFAKKTSLVEEFVWRSRAGFTDIDMFMHINNASYFSLCEYARWAWTLNSGLSGVLAKRKTSPILTQVAARYRRPINLFRAYELRSRIIHVDERAFYMTQKFYMKKELAASVLLKIQFVSKSGTVNPVELFRELDQKHDVPKVESGSADSDGLETFYALESYLLDKIPTTATASSLQ
jgi:acyl-CoA thioesterase FadM